MKIRDINRVFFVFLIVIQFCCFLHAAVTTVDINTVVANTTAADGVTAPWLTTNQNGQPLWRNRIGDFGIISADECWTAGSDYLMLKTTITGFTPGQACDVYLDFVGLNSWSIMGGLSETGIEGFSRVSQRIGANDHIGADDPSGRVVNTGTSLPASSSYAIYRAYLGTAVANGAGEIDVFVDDPDNVGVYDTYRTWYVGVAYEEIVNNSTIAWNPEPTDGQSDVDFDVTFKWNSGWADGVVNPDITYHRFFLSAPNDSTFVEDNYIEIPAGTPVNLTAEYNPSGILDADSIYSWRVDEVLSTGEIITGSVWSFMTSDPLCQNRPQTDMSGPDGVPDCIVDIHDLHWFFEQWLDSLL